MYEAADDDGLKGEATVTVTVTRNERPTGRRDRGENVDQGSRGRTRRPTRPSATRSRPTDPDDGASLTYTLGGTDAASFAIDSLDRPVEDQGGARPRDEGQLLPGGVGVGRPRRRTVRADATAIDAKVCGHGDGDRRQRDAGFRWRRHPGGGGEHGDRHRLRRPGDGDGSGRSARRCPTTMIPTDAVIVRRSRPRPVTIKTKAAARP